MEAKKKYSLLIKPIKALVDLLIVNTSLYYFIDEKNLSIQMIAYFSLLWISIALYTGFYNVYRYTHFSKVISLLIAQFFIFILAFFAYFAIFEEGEIIAKQSNIILTCIGAILVFKLLFFFFLKTYRSSGKNYRNVIIFGDNKSAQNVEDLFKRRQDLGYRFYGFFSNKKSKNSEQLGTIEEGLEYSIENSIDEIYCEVNSVTRDELKEIRNFCNENDIEFSLIPENKAIYSKNFTLEYYGTIPILKRKELPFEKKETHFIKRTFDIVFSFLVCVFLLSWLLPILWVIVKIDSKGGFFFKQRRDGIDGKQFYCYKIRSMKANNAEANKVSATKNDKRITKVGAILRKTSLDELPQFFNVLKGDMSVVGPRPHMNVQTKKYLKEIDNYIIRNSVKPGITGLAQVSGYRGEVRKKSDIGNRVRLDIFYIENWSFFLDIKIILQTILNAFKGEEAAY